MSSQSSASKDINTIHLEATTELFFAKMDPKFSSPAAKERINSMADTVQEALDAHHDVIEEKNKVIEKQGNIIICHHREREALRREMQMYVDEEKREKEDYKWMFERRVERMQELEGKVEDLMKRLVETEKKNEQ